MIFNNSVNRLTKDGFLRRSVLSRDGFWGSPNRFCCRVTSDESGESSAGECKTFSYFREYLGIMWKSLTFVFFFENSKRLEKLPYYGSLYR